MFRAHSEFQRISTIKQLKYGQQQLDDLLNLRNCYSSNLLAYLYQTRTLALDLSNSHMRHFFRPQVNKGECYQLFFLHEAEHKYVMFSFLFEFFKDKSNDHFEVMCIETLQTIDPEELVSFLEEKAFKGGLPKEKAKHCANEWLSRIHTRLILTKNEHKMTLLSLPFMLEDNRRIKVVLFTDLTALEGDHRSKLPDKAAKQLMELGMLVVIFRRDHHFGWKNTLVVNQEIDEVVIKQASQRLSKVMTPKLENEYIRYLAPIEEDKTKILDKKQSVFQSILITDNLPDPHTLRMLVYSMHPFQTKEELIGKAITEQDIANLEAA